MARYTTSRGPGMWLWLCLAVIVILADQVTKTLIIGWFQLGDSRPVTEFFNRDVTQVYAASGASGASVRGTVCVWSIGPSGEVQFGGACAAPPQRFYIDDDFARLTFYGQHVDHDHPVVGRTVTVRGAPRLLAFINVPCSRPTPSVDFGHRGRITRPLRSCADSVDGTVWLDVPGRVELRFRGDATTTHLAQVGGRQYQIPPGRLTTIRIPAPVGTTPFTVTLDWKSPLPALIGAELVQGTARTKLL